MKKLSAAAAAAVMLVTCVSCGSSGSASKEKVDISGMWKIEDNAFDGGYIFKEDGRASIYIYPDNLKFSAGALVFEDEKVAPEFISYDGSELIADYMGRLIISLKRTGENDTSSFNGEYELNDCKIREYMTQGLGITDEEQKFLVDIEDEKLRFTAVDVIDYTFDGNELVLDGNNGVSDSEGDAVLSGDTLSIKRDDGGERVLKKVK